MLLQIPGMVSFEIMLAHMFTQMLIVIVQVAVLLTVALFLFKVSKYSQTSYNQTLYLKLLASTGCSEFRFY